MRSRVLRSEHREACFSEPAVDPFSFTKLDKPRVIRNFGLGVAYPSTEPLILITVSSYPPALPPPYPPRTDLLVVADRLALRRNSKPEQLVIAVGRPQKIHRLLR